MKKTKPKSPEFVLPSLPLQSPTGIISNKNLDFLLVRGNKLGKGKFGYVEEYTISNYYDSYTKVAVKLTKDLNGIVAPDAIIEIRYLSDLKHPNVITLLDCFCFPGVFGIITPVANASLIDLAPILSLKEIKSCIYQILKGLEYIHSRGVVHVDIKSGNVLLFLQPGTSKTRYKAVIADFGLSHESTECKGIAGITRDRGFTPRYRAPECYLGVRATSSSDIWSAIVIAHDITTKSRLFNPTDLKNLSSIFYSQLILLGTPNETTWPGVTKLPKYKELFRNKLIYPGTWNERSVEPVFKAFLSRVLILDPSKRASIPELLDDPWFAEIKADVEKDIPYTITKPSCEELVTKTIEPPFVPISSIDHRTIMNKIQRADYLSLRTQYLAITLAIEAYKHATAKDDLLLDALLRGGFYIASCLLELTRTPGGLPASIRYILEHGGIKILSQATAFDYVYASKQRYTTKIIDDATVLLYLARYSSLPYKEPPITVARLVLLLSNIANDSISQERKHGATVNEMKAALEILLADIKDLNLDTMVENVLGYSKTEYKSLSPLFNRLYGLK